MPSEPPSIFQSPGFLRAGEDMLDWAHNWRRQRQLAADSEADENEPGNDTISGGGGDDPTDSTGADSLNDGEIVVLPDGSTVPDSTSPTGYMMSPVADLRNVAEAGRAVGFAFALPGRTALPPVAANPLFYGNLFLNLHHGGTFDYQRRGNWITGYTEFPQFRNVSNFNVGLFGHQAGLSLDETKSLAGAYAHFYSNNAKPNNPYGLDTDTADYIERGYKAGQTGIFNRPRNPEGNE